MRISDRRFQISDLRGEVLGLGPLVLGKDTRPQSPKPQAPSPKAKDQRPPSNPASRGFTLLEVLLALGLSAIIIGAIAMAVDVHWRALQAGRRDVEEAQLARAILNRMADDIRGAVQYDPQQAEKMLGSVVPTTVDTAKLASETGVEAKEIESALSGESGTPSWIPPSIPALYGSANVLQVDVSRLPRLDQINSMMATDPLAASVNHTSDVKSIAYYLVTEPGGVSTGAPATPSTVGQKAGLFRRELDRAMTAWASEQGTLESLQTDTDPIATEVTALEFHFFDGASWYTDWDSVELGGLPTAVEIAISLRRPAKASGATPWLGFGGTANEETSTVYRLVVNLPGAHAPAKTVEGASEDEETTDAMGDTSTTGGTSGNTGNSQNTPSTSPKPNNNPSPSPNPNPNPSPNPRPR